MNTLRVLLTHFLVNDFNLSFDKLIAINIGVFQFI